jgi:hypothetical protein
MIDHNYDDALLEALEGPYKELRDDNHITPNAILVFEVSTGTVTEVGFAELPLLYPTKGKGARWSTADLGEVVADKAMLYRKSVIAHEINDEDPSSQPQCGTVVLLIPPSGTYQRLVIQARIDESKYPQR